MGAIGVGSAKPGVAQGLTDCQMVNVLPATVSVPLRGPIAGATVKFTEPLPVPLDAEVIVIQGALLSAVHEHCGSELLIITLPAPPVAGKD